MFLPLILAGAGLGTLAGPLFDRIVERVPQHEAVLVGAGPAALAVTTAPGGCTEECRPATPHRRVLLTVLSALVFAGLAGCFGATWRGLPEMALAAMVLPLAFCDYEHLLLPRRIIWPGAVAIVFAISLSTLASGDTFRLGRAVICAVAASGLLGLVWLASPRWMAFGDVRLALPIGLALGWLGPGPTFLGFLLANFGAGAAGLLLLVLRRIHRSQPIPFGVFLAAGSIAAALIIH